MRPVNEVTLGDDSDDECDDAPLVIGDEVEVYDSSRRKNQRWIPAIIESIDADRNVTVAKPAGSRAQWGPFEVSELDVASRIRRPPLTPQTPQQPTQRGSGAAGSGEKRSLEPTACPMPGCLQSFDSAAQMAIHLVISHGEDGETPTDFGVDLITAHGDVNDAVIKLAKAGDTPPTRALGQAQQRLRFSSLKDGDARKRTVEALANFIRGLAGARSGGTGHIPAAIASIAGLRSTHGAPNAASIATVLREQSAASTAQAVHDESSIFTSPGASSVISHADSLLSLDVATPEKMQPPSAPNSAMSILPVDESLVSILEALFTQNAEWKSLLYSVVSGDGMEEVDRALFLRQLRILRPTLDGHIATMRMIGSVKDSTASNVISQLNHSIRELLVINEDFLTSTTSQGRHPFLEDLKSTGTLCYDLDSGTSSFSRDLSRMLAQMVDSPGVRKVLEKTWGEIGEKVLSVIEAVDAADMLRNQDLKSHKEITNQTYKVLQLKEACCSEVYTHMGSLMSGGDANHRAHLGPGDCFLKKIVLDDSNLRSPNSLLHGMTIYFVSKKEFTNVPAPVLKDVSLTSGPERQRRPFTCRAQLIELEQTGIRDKNSELIRVENCGTCADAKLLMSLQDQSIASVTQDTGTTVPFSLCIFVRGIKIVVTAQH